jgi:hypothetical protein
LCEGDWLSDDIDMHSFCGIPNRKKKIVSIACNLLREKLLQKVFLDHIIHVKMVTGIYMIDAFYKQ